MGRDSWRSTNSGTLVEKEVTIHTDQNGTEGRTLSNSSVASTLYPVPNRKARSLEQSYQFHPPFDSMGQHSGMEGPGSESPLGETKVDDSIQYLVELFRQPPPESCMPNLDDSNRTSVEDEKWKRFRLFRRGRKQHHAPPLVLPDTAVPARTKEGHSHIAISIPSEYSYLNLIPGSKNTQELAPLNAANTQAPDRRYSLSDYTPTTLHPIPEDRRLEESVSLETEFQREIERRFSSDHSGQKLDPVTEEQEPTETFLRMFTRPMERTQATPKFSLRDLPMPSISPESRGPEIPDLQLTYQSDPQKVGGSQRSMTPIKEELERQSESIQLQELERRASISDLGGPEAKVATHDSEIIASSDEFPVQQPSSSKSTESIRRSSDEESREESSPLARVKAIQPPPFLVGKRRSHISARASLDERLLSTKPLPVILSTQAAGTIPKIVVTAPPPHQDAQPHPPPPPALPGPLTQPEDQAVCAVKTEESPASPDEVQEVQVEKPKKAKVERIRIRLRPETPPDPDVQYPELPLQDDGAELHIQSHVSQDSRAIYDQSPSPIVPMTSKAQEQRFGDWVNDTPLSGQKPASVPSGGSTHGEIPVYDLPPLWSGSPSLPATPTSSEPQNHGEQQPREAMKGKERRPTPNTVQEQTESDPLWLSRQELVLKLEGMTDARLRDMDRRMRGLERHAETWSQSVVPLMENLNKLLEAQNRLLQSQNQSLSQSLSQGPGPELSLLSSSQRRSRRQQERRQQQQQQPPREFDPLRSTITPSPSPPAPRGEAEAGCRRAHTISGEQFRPHRRRSSSGAVESSDAYREDGERSQSPTLTEQSQGPSSPPPAPEAGALQDYHEGIVERRRTELEERIGRIPPGTAIKTAVEVTVALTQRRSNSGRHHQQQQQQREWREGRGESSRGNGNGNDRSRSESTGSSSRSRGNTSTSSEYSNDMSEDRDTPAPDAGGSQFYDDVAVD